MLPYARIATVVRGALPYATWATVAIQLGYAGYNLYQLYNSYLVQCEQDASNGCTRDISETIELVIKPRRRRDKKSKPGATTEVAADSTATDQQNDENAGQENTEPKSCCEPSAIRDAPKAVRQDGAKKTDQAEQAECSRQHEDATTIACDSHYPVLASLDQNLNDTDTEVSTSLESTDSNNGIVNDMYKECYICARPLNDANRPVATLPFCMHPFHQSCLDGVLKWHPKCPVCDYHIFSPI